MFYKLLCVIFGHYWIEDFSEYPDPTVRACRRCPVSYYRVNK